MTTMRDGERMVPELDGREWQAVRIALSDAAACGCAAPRRSGGRLARWVRWLTGIEAPRPLADPRLESLRAFVCASRARRGAATDLAPALIAQGFNARQVAALGLLAA